MKEYKIYCLKNPNNGKIRYVGVTTQKNVSTRLNQHWWNSRNNNQTHVSKWIRKIGIKPILEIIEICNKDNWEIRERYWISHFYNLTNILPGGKGVVLRRSENSIQRSINAKSKKVVQLSNTGQLLNVFNSQKEASEYHNLKSASLISAVLNNKYGNKTAAGFQWFYYSDYIVDNYKLRKRNSRVNYNNIKKAYLYSLDLKLIKEYKSLNLLAKDLGVGYTSCRKNLQKQYITKKKYYIRNYKI